MVYCGGVLWYVVVWWDVGGGVVLWETGIPGLAVYVGVVWCGVDSLASEEFSGVVCVVWDLV